MLLPFLLATGLVQLVLGHSLVMAGKTINSDDYYSRWLLSSNAYKGEESS